MTDSLFVSLCKRGCPYFHTGSLVHRWQVVFGSALLHRVHFWLMARLTSQRWLWHFPPLLYLYYDSATGDADCFTFSIYYRMYMYRLRRCRLIPLLCLTACMYSASGDDDWSLPILLSYILRCAILMLLHVVIPLSYPCKIILFIVSAIICTLLWWLMCYFLMIILNTAPRILGSSQLVSELWLTLVPGSNTLNTSSE